MVSGMGSARDGSDLAAPARPARFMGGILLGVCRFHAGRAPGRDGAGPVLRQPRGIGRMT